MSNVTSENYRDDKYFDILARSLTAIIYPESCNHPASLDGKTGFKRFIWRLLHDYLNKRNMVIYHLEEMDQEARVNGEDWPQIACTMVGMKRLGNIRECVEACLANHIEGSFVECGVWRGGSLIMMKGVLDFHGASDRKIYGFDSFQGMPKPDYKRYPKEQDIDLSDTEYLVVTEKDVLANFANFGFDMENIHLVPGWFKDTLPSSSIEKVAVLRLDGDHYESTIQILDNLYDKVSSGGFIIVDDYNSWDGCRLAVADFCEKRGINPSLTAIDNHSVYWQKT